MKKFFIFFVIIVLIAASTISFVLYNSNSGRENEESEPNYILTKPEDVEPKPFYVGVTYGGESVEEAKQLIDKVKNYTNLFVLLSGELQECPEKINEICAYAASSELHFILQFDFFHPSFFRNWLNTCEGHWGNWFLGVYFGDEMAGKMLGARVSFSGPNGEISKMEDRSTSCYLPDDSRCVFYPDGTIEVTNREHDRDTGTMTQTVLTYYPSGTVTAQIQEGDNEPTPLYDYNINYTHEELWNMRPFQTYDETAEMFTTERSRRLSDGPKNENITAFTSDFALHWFDYKAGYDVVLAQFGWNQTLEQDMALVRGAATLQNKTWGAIITWKYNHPPYLDSGGAIYNQMRTAYEAGAKYVVLFNYAKDMKGPYGTLQNEHFTALEHFWNDVVQAPDVEHSSFEAKAVLVLPQNYGWGMRDPNDSIWGLWEPDDKSPQIWQLSRSLLELYGYGLDIVYEDPEFPVEDRYPQIYYWNNTSLAH